MQDVHKSYRSSFDSAEPVARFNERFLLSLAACNRALFLDDELNVLPVSKGRDISIEAAASSSSTGSVKSKSEQELEWIKTETKSTPVVGDVIRHCRTRDQVSQIANDVEDSRPPLNVGSTCTKIRPKWS